VPQQDSFVIVFYQPNPCRHFAYIRPSALRTVHAILQ